MNSSTTAPADHPAPPHPRNQGVFSSGVRPPRARAATPVGPPQAPQ